MPRRFSCGRSMFSPTFSMSAYCWFVSADSYHDLAKPRFGLRTSAESSPTSGTQGRLTIALDRLLEGSPYAVRRQTSLARGA
jgi:hypothetical protein